MLKIIYEKKENDTGHFSMITGDTGSLETEKTLTTCLVIHVLYSGKNSDETWQYNQISNKNIIINCMFFMTKRSECDMFIF